MGVSVGKLLHYILGEDALHLQELDESFDHEVTSACKAKRWASILRCIALARTGWILWPWSYERLQGQEMGIHTPCLQQDIVSVFPYVPVSHQCLVHCTIFIFKSNVFLFSDIPNTWFSHSQSTSSNPERPCNNVSDTSYRITEKTMHFSGSNHYQSKSCLQIQGLLF